MTITPGATSQSLTIQIVDDTGLPVTGLVANTFPTTYYERVAEALTQITLANLAALTSSYSSGGVKEVGGGYYRLDVPDAAFATASKVRIIGEASGKRIIYPPIEVAYAALVANTVNITPAAAVANVGTETQLSAILGDDYSMAFSYTGDTTGWTTEFVIEDRTHTDLFSGNVANSPASPTSTLTATYAAASTASRAASGTSVAGHNAKYYYRLRRTDSGHVQTLARGEFVLLKA